MLSKKTLRISAAITALFLIVTTVLLVIFLGRNSDEKAIIEETLVETTLGKINGSFFHTRLDKKFIGFRGIRYAESPVDNLRFRVS
jgi:Carboxylesterase family